MTPNVVGFDTSTAATSACVLRSDGEAFEVLPATERLFEPPGHSRELLPAVAEAMRRAGLGWGEIGAIAVGTGPGTFTGLRIGVATARSLARARAIELRPVSSLAALAAGAGADVALALIDARRGEVFGALYERSEPVVEPFVDRPEAVAARLGDRARAALAVGDGSVKFQEVLEAAGIQVAARESRSHVVSALQVCRLSAVAQATPPEAVLPTYLRDPDAIPQS
ncbi:MAG: tRNA threonylcarbamoyladenosine biosynthesis protein TsaB [Thermoleophilaceae bacterium]|nr:tRNA threonylcarbamoyladenosine biosynthesis protein TsaB [Thermoleophilaceae bacterium]